MSELHDYITKFRNFRATFMEETGIKDDTVIQKNWELYLEHFLCMCDDCQPPVAPDISYYPQWPDRYDEFDEDTSGNGLNLYLQP